VPLLTLNGAVEMSGPVDGEWFDAVIYGAADEAEAHDLALLAAMRYARKLNPTGTLVLTETARDELDAVPFRVSPSGGADRRRSRGQRGVVRAAGTAEVS
jgi:hypothetical protein